MVVVGDVDDINSVDLIKLDVTYSTDLIAVAFDAV